MMNLDEFRIVETKLTKTMTFFLNFFSAYDKHTLTISDHKQGKSLVMQSVLKKLIEQNKIISFNFGMQRSMSLEVVQKHIEDNLLKQGGNIVAPPIGKKVIVWLDDLNLSMSKSKPESLLRNLQVQGGWFSLDKFNFTEVRNALFFMNISINEDNVKETKRVLNSLNLDVLAKSTLFKLKKYNYQDFHFVFSEIIRPAVDLVNPEHDEHLLYVLSKRFAKLIYFNRDSRQKLTNSYYANLDL